MISGRISVYLICIMFSMQVSAAASDCRTATTPAEHAICVDPELRAADAAMSLHHKTVYGVLWTKALKTELAKSQRKGLAPGDAGCANAACLNRPVVERDTNLATDQAPVMSVG